MRSLRGFFVATSLCVAALVAAPGQAHAQSAGSTVPGKEHAKRLFEEGVELEKKSDYAGALAKYKEAEQITVTPGLRFHTGYCLEMTGKLVAALDVYEAADKLARDQNKQDVRAAITARLDPLRARVPQIALRLAAAAPNGAEVQLDGVTVGAPLLDGKSFRIDPGEHVVTARAPAHRAFSRRVQVAESGTTSVDIVLELTSSPGAPAVAPVPGEPPAAGSGAGPVTEPPAERAHGRSLALPIATTAGAIVLAGAGIGLFLAAGSAQSTAKSECLAQATCDDRKSKIRTFDALALGGFVGAAGLGVLSVILWTSKPAGEASAARARMRMVASPTAVGLAGSF